MGEAAPCLMRSVSQPFFVSSEYKEGDPLRALTTSISFGRFMTEPLDWEKWSSFSHNRTLEDVQKHSRPGAVAEKKAFFEAHYKKIASKKAAKSPQKENTPPNHSPQTNISPSAPRSDTHSAIDETRENESVFSHVDEQEISSSKDVCSPSTNLVITDDDVASSGQVEQDKGSTGNVSSRENRFDDDMASRGEVELGKVSTDEKVTSEKHQLYPSCHVDKKDAISGQTKPEISSSKSKLQSRQKAPIPPIPIHQRKVSTDVSEKKRPALKFLHMSMNGALKTKDTLIQKALNLKMSVNGVKKNPRVFQRPENISHSSVACTKKRTSSSSSTVPSSFSFRSEERAAKRKEFFQKLEEKGKIKETEKIHLQPKLKSGNENKKLRRSAVLEVKPCVKETKVPSSMQKVPPMQPCPPKLGKKPTPKLVQDTCQSPWRSLKPKNFIEINKKKLTTSMVSLPTKKMSKK